MFWCYRRISRSYSLQILVLPLRNSHKIVAQDKQIDCSLSKLKYGMDSRYTGNQKLVLTCTQKEIK